MSESELKPCPFCGGHNLRVYDNGVSCDDCGALGPDKDPSRDEAIAAWNRRHPSAEPVTGDAA